MQLEIHQRQQALRDLAVGGAQSAVKKSGAALYAIGMGTGKGAYVDVQNLESLTSDSGGYVEAINEPSEITAAVARIFDELQSQYMLAFEPSHADGKYHEISVTTRTETCVCAHGRGIRQLRESRTKNEERKTNRAMRDAVEPSTEISIRFSFFVRFASSPLPVK